MQFLATNFGVISNSVDLDVALKAKADSALSTYICGMTSNLVSSPLIETLSIASLPINIRIPTDTRIAELLGDAKHRSNIVRLMTAARHFTLDKIGVSSRLVRLPARLKSKVARNIRKINTQNYEFIKSLEKICRKVNGKIVCWYSPKHISGSLVVKNIRNYKRVYKRRIIGRRKSVRKGFKMFKRSNKSSLLINYRPLSKLRLITSPTRGLSLSKEINFTNSLDFPIKKSNAMTSSSELTSELSSSESSVLNVKFSVLSIPG